ncbi:class I SAM-dependent methyltransferase [Chengkuizengella axinellae]|uniref:Class I SAM-dependent methyltransferase n=1 Tax=Chengkuizengella axinellae TaxID=3064388 RepID=A0ABT9IX73_9BACL|nr:class I SAM-dependent methyltransferase [Chengkuizengella sp. 2205SS18-9]MDP5273970.1 class I SAM-dependent methyltransferase [Chengkuizengella sp. 2205SS18-9]
MIVSTSNEASIEVIERSQAFAKELNATWMPRKKKTITKIKQMVDGQPVLIVSQKELKYYGEKNIDSPLFFHPSSSYFRIKRLIKGEHDPLIKYSKAKPGDTVLDCTAGLASDSIVFSYITGPTGSVISLESEKMMYTLIREGLQNYQSELVLVNEAMRRINVKHADHESELTLMDDNSVDIVYFDPMFRNPVQETSSFKPMRGIVNTAQLTVKSLEEARRVARKRIVLKEKKHSPEFERLGFEKVNTTYSQIAYGVIEI